MVQDFQILAIDSSKKSTGLALFNCKEGGLSCDKLHSIQPINQGNYSKTHFIAKDLIIRELECFLNSIESEFDLSNFSVALEYPIFGATVSELTFYIAQNILEFFAKRENPTDVVGYAVPTLQSFIRRCSHDKKAPKKLNDNNKAPILKIYKNSVIPYLGDSLIVDPKNSDEMDAWFLGFMASYFQGRYLRGYDTEGLDGELDKKSFGELEEKYPEIFKIQDDYYHIEFKEGCLVEDPIPFGNVDVFTLKLFKDNIKRFTERNYLSLRSTLFFPFKRISVLEEAINRKLGYDLGCLEDNSSDFIKYMTRAFGTSAHHIRKIWEEQKYFEISFNRKGKLFFVRRKVYV